MNVLSVRKLGVADIPHLKGTDVCNDAKRQLRTPLLAAFDIYKANVMYGVEKETAAMREDILLWYEALLDLEEWPLQNVPPAIARYVRG